MQDLLANFFTPAKMNALIDATVPYASAARRTTMKNFVANRIRRS